VKLFLSELLVGIVMVVLGLVGAGAGWNFKRAQGQTLAYRTAEVKRKAGRLFGQANRPPLLILKSNP